MSSTPFPGYGQPGGSSGSQDPGFFSTNQGANTNQFGTQTGSSATSQSGSSSVNPNENPLYTMFRESILPAISAQYQQAQKPVYGQAQTAQVINQANANTQGGESAIASNAARRGTLNAGSTDAANNSLQQANTAGITNFTNQLPFLNSQTSFANTQNLLGLATQFLGQSPIGSTTQGTQQGSTNTFGQSQGTQNQNQYQNPSILQDIGSLAGVAGSFIP